MMSITVNGEQREYKEGVTLASLIDDLGIKVKVMAVAVNMIIVKKNDWESYLIKEGDRVELLHFVGGG
jgi:sulfur carrier protein